MHGYSGTGKSLLLRAIISALRRKHAKKPEVVSVTASTGMAASNIGGEILLRPSFFLSPPLRSRKSDDYELSWARAGTLQVQAEGTRKQMTASIGQVN